MLSILFDYGWILVIVLGGLLAAIVLAKPILRYAVNRIADDVTAKLLSEEYTKNVAEMLPSVKRVSVVNIIELSLRAEEGKVITRPLGSPKQFQGYDNLMFQPHSMAKFSLPANAKVDMSVTIGPDAEKPLTIAMPLMISAMAYGLALSEEAKMALARAAKQLRTVTCSGEGPFLPEEAQEAGKYVLQICRWSWGGRTDEQISYADMLEVQMGQGADIGTSTVEAKKLAGRAQQLGGLAPGQDALGLPAPPGVERPEDWPKFMKDLRKRANGIPIALKVMVTDNIEEDLDLAVELGFDAIVLCGAKGGSHASTPIKQDDFGIPNLQGLVRAKKLLDRHPALRKRKISLIVAGGYFTPGECLKAIALGADAIYLATIPLFALAHNQINKVLPWEPITTLVYYESPLRSKLNIDQAATSVANILTSMVLEMEEGMRALRKSSLKELSPDDLVALDPSTAQITGVKLANEGNTQRPPLKKPKKMS